MECGILMNGLRYIVLLVTVLQFPFDVARAERAVVLVTSESCPVAEVSSLDVRKAYLGISVRIDGHWLAPIRLVGDELLESIFYQSIVNMSRKSYERRAISLTLKYGTPRAEKVDSVASAAEAVGRHQCGIVYLWKEDADRLDSIKTVRLLWRGE
jgi:hypothetical protein